MLTNEGKRKVFGELVVLSAIFEAEKTKQVLNSYVEALAEFDYQEISEALTWATKNCKWFPKPCELIERISPKPQRVDADYEAGEIISCINRFGIYRSLEVMNYLSADAWNAVLSAGGWGNLCNTPPSQLGTLRAQLRDLVFSSMSSSEIKARRAKRNALTGNNNLRLVNDYNPLSEDREAMRIHRNEKSKESMILEFKDHIKKYGNFKDKEVERENNTEKGI